MKELFPDGVIPKITDLQEELDKSNTEYRRVMEYEATHGITEPTSA